MKRFVKYVGYFIDKNVNYVYFNSKHFYTVMKDGTKRRCNYTNEQCVEAINSGWWKEAGPVERSKKVSTKPKELPAPKHIIGQKPQPFVLYEHTLRFSGGIRGYFTDNTRGKNWFQLDKNNNVKDACHYYPDFDWTCENITRNLDRGTWYPIENLPKHIKEKAKLHKPTEWEKLGINPDSDYCFASSVAVSIRSGRDVISGNMYKLARLVEKPQGEQLSVQDGMIMFEL